MEKTEVLNVESPVQALSSRILAEVRDWPLWWSELSPMDKALPAILVGLYWCALIGIGGFRGDHVSMGSLALILSYAGRKARAFRPFVMPFLLTGIFYDSQRFYADYIRGPIHVTQPYTFDKTFFGIHMADGSVLTPNEWWQLHTHPFLDLITGFAYLVFFAVFIAVSGSSTSGSAAPARHSCRPGAC